MKTIDNYGLKLCKYQAELFQKSLTKTNCSSHIFIRRFMLSDLAERMDTIGFLYSSTDTTDAIVEIEYQYGPSNYGSQKMNEEALYWTGYIYRYWAYCEGKSSREVYRIIKPKELEQLYFPYHSLDPAVAIERIKEAKGIKDVDDITRGVEILRKVRQARRNL